MEIGEKEVVEPPKNALDVGLCTRALVASWVANVDV